MLFRAILDFLDVHQKNYRSINDIYDLANGFKI